MFNLNNDKNKKVHFIGIGGISMSGLAEILLVNGYSVTGSDRAESELTNKLKKMGAKISIGHSPNNIHSQNLVIYTAAISEDNPELVKARELNIPIMDRAEFLGYIMMDFNKSIAVAGTHGKTTSTSMLSHILIHAELDPTISLGGELEILGGNVKTGKSEYFLAEACEYKGSFLKFHPFIGIILNIDADHLDYYKDITEIEETFQEFSKLIPEDGLLIGWAEDNRISNIISSSKCNILTYGINKGDFTAHNITYNETGCASYTVMFRGDFYGNLELSVPGEHNILNSLSAVCCSHFLGIGFDTIHYSLKEFGGTRRRFEKKGTKNGVTVIDDYAHHPAEIMATLKAAKNYPHKKTFCIFQPHTYTRTLNLFHEFSTAFKNTDKLILLDIYAAREKDTGIINSSMLCDAVLLENVDAVYLKSFDAAIEYLNENAVPGDLIITMGAGDVYKVGELFLKEN